MVAPNVGEPFKEKGIDARDRWCCSGDKGLWRREHRKARTSLFTPLRVALGPSQDAHLLKIRVTRGVRVADMQSFSISDDWTQSENAHRVLPFTWVGTTTFQCASDFLVDFGAKLGDVDFCGNVGLSSLNMIEIDNSQKLRM